MPSFYRSVDVRMWGDAKFCGLSKARPNGQTVWQYLITGPHTTAVPGLWRLYAAAAAHDLGWTADQFIKQFSQIESAGMAEGDWESSVVWLPNAHRYNMPKNENVVKGWLPFLDMIPECDLKVRAITSLRNNIEKAEKVLPKQTGFVSETKSEKVITQDQDQDQDQKQEQENLPDALKDLDEPERFKRYWKGNPHHERTKAWAASRWNAFLKFYAAYPVKEAPAQAWSSWLRLDPPLEECLSALKHQARKRQKADQAGDWQAEHCNPSTWLTGMRWDNGGELEDDGEDDKPRGGMKMHYDHMGNEIGERWVDA